MYIFDPENASSPIPDIGRKGRTLLKLKQSCNIPKWFAIPDSVLNGFIRTWEIDEHIRQILSELTLDNVGKTAVELTELICSTKIPDEFRREVALQLAEITDKSMYVSVRSSSGDEDGAEHSFAGIHDSYLYVNGVDSVCEHIFKVWASAYNKKALLYRCRNNLPLHPLSMAVIVQEMVDAETCGNIHTADVEKQDCSIVTVSAVYGMGPGLGKAGIKEDRYIFNKSGQEINTAIGMKNRKVCLNTNTRCGVCELPVEEKLRSLPVLSSIQVEKLVAEALDLELLFGCPQEIDFCFDETGQMYILQCRGILGLKDYGPCAGNDQQWDNSLISNKYAGVTSPMTYSFVRNSCVAGSHAFKEVAGISQKDFEDNRDLFYDITGFFDGRIFLNINNLIRISKLVPGYYCFRRFFESLTGRAVRETGAVCDQSATLWFKAIKDIPRVAFFVIRSSLLFMTLGMRNAAFKRRIVRFIEKREQSNFKGVQPHELMKIYSRLEKDL